MSGMCRVYFILVLPPFEGVERTMTNYITLIWVELAWGYKIPNPYTLIAYIQTALLFRQHYFLTTFSLHSPSAAHKRNFVQSHITT